MFSPPPIRIHGAVVDSQPTTAVDFPPLLRACVTVLALIMIIESNSGCVGSGEGLPDAASSVGVPRTYEDIQVMIFDPLCSSSCHKGGAAPKGLSLEAAQSHRSLVGVPSQEVADMMRVAPGQPDESYLIVKVVAFDPRRVNLRMPRNGPPWLSNAQIQALRRWITAGAKNNWIDEEPDAGMVPVVDAGPADAGIDDAGIVDADSADSMMDSAP